MLASTIKHNDPLKRIYRNGNSAVVAIAPSIVKELNLDNETFCEETIENGGIFLKIRKLASTNTNTNSEDNEKNG
jgi:antitoxin component of MazEF toxin-antitoxin module